MKIYFFGVQDAGRAGHYLSELVDGQLRHVDVTRLRLPFLYTKLDGGFLPDTRGKRELEVQGLWHHTFVDGWSIISCWDRTGDSRYASNASFVVEGMFDIGEMKRIAAAACPALWNRISGSEVVK